MLLAAPERPADLLPHEIARDVLASLGRSREIVSAHAGAQRWSVRSRDTMVHVAPPGSGDLLERESLVLDSLDERLPTPRTLAAGSTFGASWRAQELLPGAPLSVVWPLLTRSQRESALSQAANLLAELHASPAPAGLSAISWSLGGVELFEERLERIASDGLLPAPLHREVLAWLRAHPGMEATHPSLERVLVHGDFQPGNLLWDGENILVVDFELAHEDQRDFELLALTPGFRGLGGLGRHSALEVLRSEYPLLWSHPHHKEREILTGLLRRMVLLEKERDLVPAYRSPGAHLSEMARLLLGGAPTPGSLPQCPVPAR